MHAASQSTNPMMLQNVRLSRCLDRLLLIVIIGFKAVKNIQVEYRLDRRITMVRKLNCMNSSTLNISAWAVGSWWFWVGYIADDSCCCSPDTTSVDKSWDCCFGKSSKHSSSKWFDDLLSSLRSLCLLLNGSIDQTLSADWSILSSKIDKTLHSSNDVDNGIIALNDTDMKRMSQTSRAHFSFGWTMVPPLLDENTCHDWMENTDLVPIWCWSE